MDSVVPITYEAATGGKQGTSKCPRIRRKIRPSEIAQLSGNIWDGFSVSQSLNSVLCLFRWGCGHAVQIEEDLETSGAREPRPQLPGPALAAPRGQGPASSTHHWHRISFDR